MTLKQYMIEYGSEEFIIFDADSPAHAAEQFKESEPNETITQMQLCVDILNWGADEPVNLYVNDGMGSWFGLDDMNIIAVPANMMDAEEIDNFIKEIQ